SRKSKFLQIPLYNMMKRLTNDNNLEIFTTEPRYSNNSKETNMLREESDLLINLSDDAPTEMVSQETSPISKDVLELDDNWFHNKSEESTYETYADSIEEYQ